MERREFLIGTVAAVGSRMVAPTSLHAEMQSETAPRTYHVLGVPLRAGSLTPGNEDDARAYRDANLVTRLQSAGCKAVDDGDVEIPSYLPHHSIPPIRSWPSPRIAWECVGKRVEPILRQPGQVPLLIGCDCSVVLGTTQAMMRALGEDIYVIYVDGDFDDATPIATHCDSAASCATWLLTHESPFWAGPILRRSQISVIGWSSPSRAEMPAVEAISRIELRRTSATETARQVLGRIPKSASVLLHFDIDVLQRKEMPAAYFPHDEGLTMAEVAELLGVILKDPRVRLIEVSEYASLRDFDRSQVGRLVELLTGVLKA
jgi:arginase